MQFYSFNLFHLFNRIYCSPDICVILNIFVFIVFILLISSTPKSGLVLSEWSTLHLFFFVHVLNKIWVQEVGTRTNRSVAISVALSLKKTHGE
jgi:hypothetical protein